MGAMVVEKVRSGVIISLFFFKFKLFRAKRLAEEPEFTINANFLPKILNQLS